MRWLKRILVFGLVVVLAASAFGVFTVRRSFPVVNGELELEGLSGSVEVLRDGLGVPHIYASSQHDLFFAQGFTHAQDRFWQMDFWRHIGAGRISELFGESQVDTDRFLRSLGFEALSTDEWNRVGSPVREVLQSYADGVNAYLADRSGAGVSLEYAVLGLTNRAYEIEPWTPVHTLMWAKVMAWDLGQNMEEEITRAVLAGHLGTDRTEQLYPSMPDDRPVIVENGQWTADTGVTVETPPEAIGSLLAARAGRELVMEVTRGGFEGIGSNNWVVGGAMTRSGLPLLANDTHLGIQMPSIWYANGLHCVEVSPECAFNVVGFSFAGTPGVVIGHNGHHAWGVTNQAADTQDLFIERVNPDDPGQYEVDGEWVDFETRTETITVAGGENVTFEALSSRHGPVISGTFLDDELDHTPDVPADYAVALAWTALQPSTLVEAIVGINLATSYEEFATAVALWDIAPQSVVYADVEGNIAYHATGRIPIRAAGDGRYPVPGWTSEYDWLGFVPVEELPRMLNPAQGFIQTANQPVLRSPSTPLIGTDAAYGYRGGRIVDMILAVEDHDVSSMQIMQMDNRDGGAEVIVPYLVAVDDGGDPVIEEVHTWLESWSRGNNAYQASGRSTGAAVYQAVWRHLLANTFQSELPEEFWPRGRSRWAEAIGALLETPDDPWWNDVSTLETETRDDILRRSMRDAHAELTELLGSNPSSWTWGALHITRFENQTFGQSGIRPIEWLFNRSAPDRVGGSSSIVNAVGWNAAESYVVDWVPSQRLVVDLDDPDASTFIHTTGQSGHAFHSNYDSMIEMWVDGEQAPLPWTREAVEEITIDRMSLVPGG